MRSVLHAAVLAAVIVAAQATLVCPPSWWSQADLLPALPPPALNRCLSVRREPFPPLDAMYFCGHVVENAAAPSVHTLGDHAAALAAVRRSGAPFAALGGAVVDVHGTVVWFDGTAPTNATALIAAGALRPKDSPNATAAATSSPFVGWAEDALPVAGPTSSPGSAVGCLALNATTAAWAVIPCEHDAPFLCAVRDTPTTPAPPTEVPSTNAPSGSESGLGPTPAPEGSAATPAPTVQPCPSGWTPEPSGRCIRVVVPAAAVTAFAADDACLAALRQDYPAAPASIVAAVADDTAAAHEALRFAATRAAIALPGNRTVVRSVAGPVLTSGRYSTALRSGSWGSEPWQGLPAPWGPGEPSAPFGCVAVDAAQGGLRLVDCRLPQAAVGCQLNNTRLLAATPAPPDATTAPGQASPAPTPAPSHGPVTPAPAADPCLPGWAHLNLTEARDRRPLCVRVVTRGGATGGSADSACRDDFAAAQRALWRHRPGAGYTPRYDRPGDASLRVLLPDVVAATVQGELATERVMALTAEDRVLIGASFVQYGHHGMWSDGATEWAPDAALWAPGEPATDLGCVLLVEGHAPHSAGPVTRWRSVPCGVVVPAVACAYPPALLVPAPATPQPGAPPPSVKPVNERIATLSGATRIVVARGTVGAYRVDTTDGVPAAGLLVVFTSRLQCDGAAFAPVEFLERHRAAVVAVSPEGMLLPPHPDVIHDGAVCVAAPTHDGATPRFVPSLHVRFAVTAAAVRSVAVHLLNASTALGAGGSVPLDAVSSGTGAAAEATTTATLPLGRSGHLSVFGSALVDSNGAATLRWASTVQCNDAPFTLLPPALRLIPPPATAHAGAHAKGAVAGLVPFTAAAVGDNTLRNESGSAAALQEQPRLFHLCVALPGQSVFARTAVTASVPTPTVEVYRLQHAVLFASDLAQHGAPRPRSTPGPRPPADSVAGSSGTARTPLLVARHTSPAVDIVGRGLRPGMLLRLTTAATCAATEPALVHTADGRLAVADSAAGYVDVPLVPVPLAEADLALRGGLATRGNGTVPEGGDLVVMRAQLDAVHTSAPGAVEGRMEGTAVQLQTLQTCVSFSATSVFFSTGLRVAVVDHTVAAVGPQPRASLAQGFAGPLRVAGLRTARRYTDDGDVWATAAANAASLDTVGTAALRVRFASPDTTPGVPEPCAALHAGAGYNDPATTGVAREALEVAPDPLDGTAAVVVPPGYVRGATMASAPLRVCLSVDHGVTFRPTPATLDVRPLELLSVAGLFVTPTSVLGGTGLALDVGAGRDVAVPLGGYGLFPDTVDAVVAAPGASCLFGAALADEDIAAVVNLTSIGTLPEADPGRAAAALLPRSTLDALSARYGVAAVLPLCLRPHGAAPVATHFALRVAARSLGSVVFRPAASAGASAGASAELPSVPCQSIGTIALRGVSLDGARVVPAANCSRPASWLWAAPRSLTRTANAADAISGEGVWQLTVDTDFGGDPRCPEPGPGAPLRWCVAAPGEALRDSGVAYRSSEADFADGLRVPGGAAATAAELTIGSPQVLEFAGVAVRAVPNAAVFLQDLALPYLCGPQAAHGPAIPQHRVAAVRHGLWVVTADTLRGILPGTYAVCFAAGRTVQSATTPATHAQAPSQALISMFAHAAPLLVTVRPPQHPSVGLFLESGPVASVAATATVPRLVPVVGQSLRHDGSLRLVPLAATGAVLCDSPVARATLQPLPDPVVVAGTTAVVGLYIHRTLDAAVTAPTSLGLCAETQGTWAAAGPARVVLHPATIATVDTATTEADTSFGTDDAPVVAPTATVVPQHAPGPLLRAAGPGLRFGAGAAVVLLPHAMTAGLALDAAAAMCGEAAFNATLAPTAAAAPSVFVAAITADGTARVPPHFAVRSGHYALCSRIAAAAPWAPVTAGSAASITVAPRRAAVTGAPATVPDTRAAFDVTVAGVGLRPGTAALVLLPSAVRCDTAAAEQLATPPLWIPVGPGGRARVLPSHLAASIGAEGVSFGPAVLRWCAVFTTGRMVGAAVDAPLLTVAERRVDHTTDTAVVDRVSAPWQGQAAEGTPSRVDGHYTVTVAAGLTDLGAGSARLLTVFGSRLGSRPDGPLEYGLLLADPGSAATVCGGGGAAPALALTSDATAAGDSAVLSVAQARASALTFAAGRTAAGALFEVCVRPAVPPPAPHQPQPPHAPWRPFHRTVDSAVAVAVRVRVVVPILAGPPLPGAAAVKAVEVAAIGGRAEAVFPRTTVGPAALALRVLSAAPLDAAAVSPMLQGLRLWPVPSWQACGAVVESAVAAPGASWAVGVPVQVEGGYVSLVTTSAALNATDSHLARFKLCAALAGHTTPLPSEVRVALVAPLVAADNAAVSAVAVAFAPAARAHVAVPDAVDPGQLAVAAVPEGLQGPARQQALAAAVPLSRDNTAWVTMPGSPAALRPRTGVELVLLRRGATEGAVLQGLRLAVALPVLHGVVVDGAAPEATALRPERTISAVTGLPVAVPATLALTASGTLRLVASGLSPLPRSMPCAAVLRRGPDELALHTEARAALLPQGALRSVFGTDRTEATVALRLGPMVLPGAVPLGLAPALDDAPPVVALGSAAWTGRCTVLPATVGGAACPAGAALNLGRPMAPVVVAAVGLAVVCPRSVPGAVDHEVGLHVAGSAPGVSLALAPPAVTGVVAAAAEPVGGRVATVDRAVFVVVRSGSALAVAVQGSAAALPGTVLSVATTGACGETGTPSWSAPVVGGVAIVTSVVPPGIPHWPAPGTTREVLQAVARPLCASVAGGPFRPVPHTAVLVANTTTDTIGQDTGGKDAALGVEPNVIAVAANTSGMVALAPFAAAVHGVGAGHGHDAHFVGPAAPLFPDDSVVMLSRSCLFSTHGLPRGVVAGGEIAVLRAQHTRRPLEVKVCVRRSVVLRVAGRLVRGFASAGFIDSGVVFRVLPAAVVAVNEPVSRTPAERLTLPLPSLDPTGAVVPVRVAGAAAGRVLFRFGRPCDVKLPGTLGATRALVTTQQPGEAGAEGAGYLLLLSPADLLEADARLAADDGKTSTFAVCASVDGGHLFLSVGVTVSAVNPARSRPAVSAGPRPAATAGPVEVQQGLPAAAWVTDSSFAAEVPPEVAEVFTRALWDGFVGHGSLGFVRSHRMLLPPSAARTGLVPFAASAAGPTVNIATARIAAAAARVACIDGVGGRAAVYLFTRDIGRPLSLWAACRPPDVDLNATAPPAVAAASLPAAGTTLWLREAPCNATTIAAEVTVPLLVSRGGTVAVPHGIVLARPEARYHLCAAAAPPGVSKAPTPARLRSAASFAVVPTESVSVRSVGGLSRGTVLLYQSERARVAVDGSGLGLGGAAYSGGFAADRGVLLRFVPLTEGCNAAVRSGGPFDGARLFPVAAVSFLAAAADTAAPTLTEDTVAPRRVCFTSDGVVFREARDGVRIAVLPPVALRFADAASATTVFADVRELLGDAPAPAAGTPEGGEEAEGVATAPATAREHLASLYDVNARPPRLGPAPELSFAPRPVLCSRVWQVCGVNDTEAAPLLPTHVSFLAPGVPGSPRLELSGRGRVTAALYHVVAVARAEGEVEGAEKGAGAMEVEEDPCSAAAVATSGLRFRVSAQDGAVLQGSVGPRTAEGQAWRAAHAARPLSLCVAVDQAGPYFSAGSLHPALTEASTEDLDAAPSSVAVAAALEAAGRPELRLVAAADDARQSPGDILLALFFRDPVLPDGAAFAANTAARSAAADAVRDAVAQRFGVPAAAIPVEAATVVRHEGAAVIGVELRLTGTAAEYGLKPLQEEEVEEDPSADPRDLIAAKFPDPTSESLAQAIFSPLALGTWRVQPCVNLSTGPLCGRLIGVDAAYADGSSVGFVRRGLEEAAEAAHPSRFPAKARKAAEERRDNGPPRLHGVPVFTPVAEAQWTAPVNRSERRRTAGALPDADVDAAAVIAVAWSPTDVAQRGGGAQHEDPLVFAHATYVGVPLEGGRPSVAYALAVLAMVPVLIVYATYRCWLSHCDPADVIVRRMEEAEDSAVNMSPEEWKASHGASPPPSAVKPHPRKIAARGRSSSFMGTLPIPGRRSVHFGAKPVVAYVD